MSLRLQLLLLISVCASCARATDRQSGGHYTPDRLANVLANVAKYDWARRERDVATSNARAWIKQADEVLWNIIPGQQLPRTIDVTWDYNHPEKPRIGCLVCGEKIFRYGNYPYVPNIWKAPWKLKCPSCGSVFPTNDFGAYYKSGIEEHGVFNPAKANRSLLYNTAHPNPKDPLHTFGVDDGYGFVDANGRTHKFIAYYTWKLWNEIMFGTTSLSNAYVYTGEQKYAHKAAILLDRIADVYPDMDWKPYADRGWYHSDGGSHLGKIGGRIWETWYITDLATDYDRIIPATADDPALYKFLAAKAAQYKLLSPKGTRADLLQGIDNGLLRTSWQALHSGRIFGNDGMKQHGVTACALALNTQPETNRWLDSLFSEKDGQLPEIILNGLDRDGTGAEGAPNYSLLWIDKLLAIGQLLDLYPAYTNHNLFREFPQLRQSFTAGWRMNVLGLTTPNIGDSGATGLMLKTQCKPAFIAQGYRYYHDPQIARAAFEANDYSAKNLLHDALDPNPDALTRQLAEAALSTTTPVSGNVNMPGFGLAKFEFGRGTTGSALWCYYGRNGGHGHHDQFNLDIYSYGIDISPDLGYPEFATPTWLNRLGWHANTLSHNTVVVDGKPERECWDAEPEFYFATPGLGAFSLSSSELYPQCSQFARDLLYVQAGSPSDAYILDVFRISGGKDHLLSFHGPPGPVAAPALHLDKQSTGTYAGIDVPFGTSSTSVMLGYSYLYNVARAANPPAQFTLDWKAQFPYRDLKRADDVHLRMHVLNSCNDVALADADPPQNKPGNPRRIRYALVHRTGENLCSTFASVIEPYNSRPLVTSVTRLQTTPSSDQLVAVRVRLASGATDYLLSSPDQTTVTTENGITFSCREAFLRERGGKVTSANMICGSALDYHDVHLRGIPGYRGEVVQMEHDASKPATLLVTGNLPAAHKLEGRQILFSNDRKRNGWYPVLSATTQSSGTLINCGNTSFIRGLKNRHDYSQGCVYELDEGTSFSIPIMVSK